MCRDRPRPPGRVPAAFRRPVFRRPLWRPLLATALFTALAFASSPSRAQSAAEGASEGLQLATAAERPELRREWTPSADPLDHMSENLHIHKGTGLEYRRRMLVGERSVELGLQGPVVRKKKSLGLTVVVRF